MIQLCHALLVTPAPSSGWTSSSTMFFSRPGLAELRHIACIQLHWSLYWDRATVFHFPKFVTIILKSPVCTVDHWVIYPAAFFPSYSSAPLPWPFLLHSMMLHGGASNHIPPLPAKMVSPRKGKYLSWACQGLELSSGKRNRKTLSPSLDSENWKNEAGAACSHVSYCCIQ